MYIFLGGCVHPRTADLVSEFHFNKGCSHHSGLRFWKENSATEAPIAPIGKKPTTDCPRLSRNATTCTPLTLDRHNLVCTRTIIAQTAIDKGFDGSEFGFQGASIAPVPQRLALAPDRFYLWLVVDFERWAIPIQLTQSEARSLLPLVEGEHDRAVVLRIIERAIGGAS